MGGGSQETIMSSLNLSCFDLSWVREGVLTIIPNYVQMACLASREYYVYRRRYYGDNHRKKSEHSCKSMKIGQGYTWTSQSYQETSI